MSAGLVSPGAELRAFGGSGEMETVVLQRTRRGPGARLAKGSASLALGAALACAGSLRGLAGLPGTAALPRRGAALDETTIAAGLRDALRVGARNAVAITSREDGFLGNERIRIRAPESLEPIWQALRNVGFAGQPDELELAMNRAAERAAGEATRVFLDAIQGLTIQDARDILAGGDSAATDYLRRTSSDTLRARFEPIVSEKLRSVGLARLYDGMLARYRALPVPKQPAPDLEDYVTDRALDGLFAMLGEEEKRIRSDPAARVTDLLRTVFGGA